MEGLGLMTDTRYLIRSLATAALVSLALGLAACGGSDDQGEASTGSSRDEKALRAAVGNLQDALYGARAKDYCDGLTADGVVKTAKAAGKKSCEAAVRALVPQPLSSVNVANSKSRILRVKIDGNKATVTTKEPTDRPPLPVPFVKQGGKWKMDLALKVER